MVRLLTGKLIFFKGSFLNLLAIIFIVSLMRPVCSAPLPRGTKADDIGPNLIVDWSFESMEPGVMVCIGGQWLSRRLDAPFKIVEDSDAHSGKALVRVSLSRSGKMMYSHIETWENTDYVSSLWVRGNGSGTFFVATKDLSKKIVHLPVRGTNSWRKVELRWNSGEATAVIIGFCDDISEKGTLYLDDIYTGLAHAHTIAFTAPPAYDPEPHAPPGFKLIFNDEFRDIKTIDVENTQKDGYKWYVKGMWFPSTSPSMYEILPSYKGAKGVLVIKDAPVSMGWNFATTLFDDEQPEGYRGTVFQPGKGIYYEARIAVANPEHISQNGWPAFWSVPMPVASRSRNMNPPPWSFSPENYPMPGWPGRWEVIEDDIMEYNPSWGANHHSSTIHDWFNGNNIGNFNAVVYPPYGTDYREWHTYGELWVPATAENGWYGYRQIYFDGVPQQAICWRGNQIAQNGQPSGSYLFSMIDGTPLSPPLWRNLQIGGAMGGIPNTYIDYVRVYAIDPKASIRVVRKQKSK